MPTARYAVLDTSADGDGNDDMEAAFDLSEDEDETVSESQPLNPDSAYATQTLPLPRPQVLGIYDFENVDYDYPPPGSPPRPSAMALPNDYGNSNGLVPQTEIEHRAGPHRSWVQRSAAALLPAAIAQRIGVIPRTPSGVVGDGTQNDGVFANVTAKPSRAMTIQEGDETYIVPEDSRAEAPPSYISAQSDAVPPYWENTVHAPLTPGAAGEIIVDALPTGTLFSFFWNMLVSVSFQFVGFLLTYLLHTTHAARFGSRAGLGVTLIQSGLTLRGRMDGLESETGGEMSKWPGWNSEPRPNRLKLISSAARSFDYRSNPSFAPTNVADQQANILVADAATEWISFFLMTLGWFILLTSLAGFWRVKRWERSILASQSGNIGSGSTATSPFSILSRFEQSFSLPRASGMSLLRLGFGFGSLAPSELDNAVRGAEEGSLSRDDGERILERDLIDSNNLEPSLELAQLLERDRRLQRDLRDAGLL